MKRRIILAAAIVVTLVAVFFGLSRCSSEEVGPTTTVSDLNVIHETEFGGVYLSMPIDEFNDAGFEYGDSVKIVFSNGYTLEDIPYYNGFYTQVGEPLLIAYPGYAYIKAHINNGDDLWEVAQLEDGMTADISVMSQGKYAAIQNARDIHYEDDRGRFESDEQFANFRNVVVGDIAEGVLYRSASPCDNQHNRATYVNTLIEEAGVKSILDLADNNEKIQAYITADGFSCDYFLSLYESSNVIPIALSMNYASEEFRTKLADGLTRMTEDEGPFLVHCTEGKDRTGFVCMVLEALCGANYDEIVDDYMVTYDNYYGISKTQDKDKYDVIVSDVLDPMVRCMIGDDTADPSVANLQVAAEIFLRGSGMSDDAITALRTMLTR